MGRLRDAEASARPSCRRRRRDAGTATREALATSTERQSQLASSVMGRLQDLGTALRRDVSGALAAAGADEAAALGRLEARLAVRCCGCSKGAPAAPAAVVLTGAAGCC